MFTILSIDEGPVAPNWPTGIGILSGYLGPGCSPGLPDGLIRRIVGVLVIAIAVLLLWSGLD